MKPSLLTEIRGWLDSLLTVLGLYLAWRWRPHRERPVATTRAPAALGRVTLPSPAALNLSPAQGVASGALAIRDSMAETDPDFPQF